MLRPLTEQEMIGSLGILDRSRGEQGPPPAGPCPAIRSEWNEGVLVIAPTVPHLDDETSVADIRQALDGLLIGAGSPPRIVIDLYNLASMSGRGIGLFLSFHVRLRRLGGCLRLARASDQVVTAMEIVGMPSLVEIIPTVDEAMAARWPA